MTNWSEEAYNHQETTEASLLEKIESTQKDPDLKASAEQFLYDTKNQLDNYHAIFEQTQDTEIEDFFEIENALYQQGLNALQTHLEKEEALTKRELKHFLAEFKKTVFSHEDAEKELKAAFFELAKKKPRGTGSGNDYSTILLHQNLSLHLTELPYFEDLLKVAAEEALKNGDYQFLFSEELIKRTSTRPVIKQAVEAALSSQNEILGFKYLQRVIESCDKIHANAFKIHLLRSKEVVDFVDRFSKSHPKEFLTFNSWDPGVKLFNFLPRNKKRIQESFENLSLRGKLEVLSYLELKPDKGKVLLRNLLDQALEDDPMLIFYTYNNPGSGSPRYLLSEADWKIYLHKAAQEDPLTAFKTFSTHNQEDIFLEAAEKIIQSDFFSACFEFIGEPEQPYPSRFVEIIREKGIAEYPDLYVSLHALSQQEYPVGLNKEGINKLIDDSTLAKAEKALGTGVNRWEMANKFLQLENVATLEAYLSYGITGPELIRDWVKDPLLKNLYKVHLEWVTGESQEEKEENAVLIARFLESSQIPVSEKAVAKAQMDLDELEKEYANIPIFKNRNILLASHSEKTPEGKDMFGKEAWKTYLERAVGQGNDFHHFEAIPGSLEDLKNTKIELLKTLTGETESATTKPLTFVWDGHGGEDAIYLSDGQMDTGGKPKEREGTVKISVEELGDALLNRGKKTDLSKDILIFDSCLSYNFAQNLNTYLLNHGASNFPIILASSEYGQISYGYEKSANGTEILDYFAENVDVSVGDFMKKAFKMHNGAVFVFHGKSIQIAKTEETHTNSAA